MGFLRTFWAAECGDLRVLNGGPEAGVTLPLLANRLGLAGLSIQVVARIDRRVKRAPIVVVGASPVPIRKRHAVPVDRWSFLVPELRTALVPPDDFGIVTRTRIGDRWAFGIEGTSTRGVLAAALAATDEDHLARLAAAAPADLGAVPYVEFLVRAPKACPLDAVWYEAGNGRIAPLPADLCGEKPDKFHVFRIWISGRRSRPATEGAEYVDVPIALHQRNIVETLLRHGVPRRRSRLATYRTLTRRMGRNPDGTDAKSVRLTFLALVSKIEKARRGLGHYAFPTTVRSSKTFLGTTLRDLVQCSESADAWARLQYFPHEGRNDDFGRAVGS